MSRSSSSALVADALAFLAVVVVLVEAHSRGTPPRRRRRGKRELLPPAKRDETPERNPTRKPANRNAANLLPHRRLVDVVRWNGATDLCEDVAKSTSEENRLSLSRVSGISAYVGNPFARAIGKNCAADTRYRHAGAGQYSHAEWQPLPLLFFVSSEDRLIRKMPAGHEDQGLLSIAQLRKRKRSGRSSFIPSGTGRTGVAGEGVTDANVLAPPFA